MLSSSHRGRAPRDAAPPPCNRRRRDGARQPCNRRRRDGLTLIEAVVALVMLGLAGVTALEGAAQATRAERAGQAHLTAVSLADGRMESLAASPADSLRRSDPFDEGTIETLHGAYHWRTIVRPAARHVDLIEASVRMEWNEGSYSLATTLYRPDENARRGGVRVPGLTADMR